MLVLSRKIDEKLSLSIEQNGGLVPLGSLQVTSVEGKRIKIGLDLRKDIRIVRYEADGNAKDSK